MTRHSVDDSWAGGSGSKREELKGSLRTSMHQASDSRKKVQQDEAR